MQVFIVDPVLQTYLFIAIFLVVLLCSIRLRRDQDMTVDNIVPVSITTEIKGFAVLAIIFAHIGYSLASDDRFLFPLSVLGGVGVDLFLLMSGFGLAMSALKKHISPMQFYLRRVSKIYAPLWIVLVSVLLLDWFVLEKSYLTGEIVASFFGYFPLADLWSSINSPLWFITPILFYYAVFPLFFKQRSPVVSALLFFFVSSFVVDHIPDRLSGVEHLYRLHTMAFPLGVALAGILVSSHTQRLFHRVAQIYTMKKREWSAVLRCLIAAVCLCIAAYFSIHSGVGQEPFVEQYTSVGIVLAFISFFAIKPFIFRSLVLTGLVSYEVYLLHWPLLSRFDVWYQMLPASVATVVHICILVVVGYLLQYMCTRLSFLIQPKMI